MMMRKESEATRIILFISIFFLAWIARVYCYPVIDDQLTSETARSISSNSFRFSICVLPVFFYLMFLDRTEPFIFLRLKAPVQPSFYWSFFVLLIGAGYQFILIRFNVDAIANDHAGDILSSVLLTPLMEEITFRGFIQHKLTEVTTSFNAILITAILFVLIHYPGWLYLPAQHFSLSRFFTQSLAVMILGLFAGLLVYKSRSLYPAILLHGINNFISAV